jgi:hypothetical protein
MARCMTGWRVVQRREDGVAGETTRGRQEEAAIRTEELLRADEAAAIDDDLDDLEVEGSAARNERSATVLRPRSQVYSIRVPVERLEQLRQLAKERGVAPTVMLRQWVLERLDAATGAVEEPEAQPEPTSMARARPAGAQSAPVDEPEAASAALLEMVGQLSRSLAAFADAWLAERSQNGLPVYDMAFGPSTHGPTLSGGAPPGEQHLTWARGSFVRQTRLAAARSLSVDFLNSGLAELRSTVARVSRTPEMVDQDLGEFYLAADEEMSLP